MSVGGQKGWSRLELILAFKLTPLHTSSFQLIAFKARRVLLYGLWNSERKL